MHPVQTAMEKDLCLVTLVQPQIFLPHLVCALLTALVDTMLMKCVKVSTFIYYYIFSVMQLL